MSTKGNKFMISLDEELPTEPRVPSAIVELQVLLHAMLETTEVLANALKATIPTIAVFDSDLAHRCCEAQHACDRISTYIRERNEREPNGQD